MILGEQAGGWSAHPISYTMDIYLPHPDNTMQADIERLRTTLVAADADVTAQIAETRRRWVHDFIGLKL